MPELSIIIVNWNGLQYLQPCLESITSQTFQDFEIVLVDNGSTDGSIKWIESRYPSITLIKNNKNEGFCLGNNIGCKIAKGNLLLLLNADTELEQNALAELVNAAHAGYDSWIGIVPKVLFKDEPFFINSLGVHWHHQGHWRDIRVGRMDIGAFPDGERVFGAIFPAILFHAERFREIGRFDPLFFSYCEDFDVCYRANIFGYNFYTAPKARIIHAYRSSIKSDAVMRWHTYLFTRNYLLVFLKNYQRSSLWKYRKQIFKRYLSAPIYRLLKQKKFWETAPYIKAFLWLLLFSPVIAKKRLPLQYHRRVADTALWSFAPVEETNLFHFNGAPVMSLLALRTSLNEKQTYTVDGIPYNTL